jgi:hypothetical protein
VCALSAIEDGPRPEVRFTAHPHGGPECLWFHFELSLRADQAGEAWLVLEHLETMLGAGDPEALWPVYRWDDDPWRRLPAGHPRITPDGRVEAAWLVAVPRGAARLSVAFCYPYGEAELADLMASTERRLVSNPIGVTQSGRPIPRLSTHPGSPSGETPGVYVIARQHSGETPGSWVLDGLLRAAAESPGNRLLIWAVPLAHLDGVVGGDYGKDGFPYDLNRAWGQPPMRHEVLCIQRDLGRWARRCAPVAALDLHAPGGCETDGVYAFLPHAVPAEGRAAELARRLLRALEDKWAAADFVRRADYPSRWDTPNFTAYMTTRHDVPAVTLEIPYGAIGDRVLTIDDYRAIGARLFEALSDMS